MTSSPIFLTILGAVIYFLFEFKSRATTSFQFGYWIKQNWYNILTVIACDIAYIQLLGTPSKEIALVLGLLPNLAVDWIQDLIKKYTTPKV